MSQPPKRPRNDDGMAEQEAEDGAGASSSSAPPANLSQQGTTFINGVEVAMSFVCTTAYRPPSILFLLIDGTVAFQNNPHEAVSASHGSWALSADGVQLRVWFHYAANWRRIREHLYIKIAHTNSFELATAEAAYKSILIRRTS
jgi:hypothetical protein